MRITNMHNNLYCFEIKLNNSKMLRLTSFNKKIFYKNSVFYPFSGLNVKEGSFNDSGSDRLELEGIYEEQGIARQTDLTNAQVKVLILYENNFHLLADFTVTKFLKYDLNFLVILEPESIKYNQTIVKTYSKTCRANFGDLKCRASKEVYSKVYKIKEIIGYEIILENCDKESGYYTFGSAYIKEINFQSKITSHSNNSIKLDTKIERGSSAPRAALLTAGCDKSFITCCNKFNNAVNFRGEPFIPDESFLKII